MSRNTKNYLKSPESGSDNPLYLNGAWYVDDVEVTARAADINSANTTVIQADGGTTTIDVNEIRTVRVEGGLSHTVDITGTITSDISNEVTISCGNGGLTITNQGFILETLASGQEIRFTFGEGTYSYMIGDDKAALDVTASHRTFKTQVSTTDATPLVLYSEVIPTGKTISLDVNVIGRTIEGTPGAAGTAGQSVYTNFKVAVEIVAGVAAVIGTTPTITVEKPVGSAYDVTFTTAGDEVFVNITGIADVNMRWTGRIGILLG